jgi:hypothetical protein
MGVAVSVSIVEIPVSVPVGCNVVQVGVDDQAPDDHAVPDGQAAPEDEAVPFHEVPLFIGYIPPIVTVVVGNADTMVEGDGPTETSGTVTVRVTRSVEVDIKSAVVDVLAEDDMLVMVIVWRVVGEGPEDVEVTETEVVVEFDVVDELNELSKVVMLDEVVEPVADVELIVDGTVTIVVVVLKLILVDELAVVIVVVLESELVAADAVTVTVTIDVCNVATVDELDIEDAVLVLVVDSDVLPVVNDGTVVVVLGNEKEAAVEVEVKAEVEMLPEIKVAVAVAVTRTVG